MLPSDRNLKNYLPDFLIPYFERQLDAEEPEFEQAWENTADFLENAFLFTAHETGIERLERILKITPLQTDSLDDRRFIVHARLNTIQIVTVRTMEEQLTALCGPGEFIMTVNHDQYILDVKINLGVKRHFDAAKEMLNRLAPANLLIHVTLLYNTHLVLADYTHGQLAAHTHKQLREDIFDA